MSKTLKVIFIISTLPVSVPIFICGMIAQTIRQLFMSGWCYSDSLSRPEYYKNLEQTIKEKYEQ